MRRRFLGALGGLTGLAALSQVPVSETALAAPRPRGGDYPFTLGVASGDPHAGRRGAVDPAGARALQPRRRHAAHGRVPVDWEVARDPRLRHVVRSRHGPGAPRARPLGARRGRRAAAGARVLLPRSATAGDVSESAAPHRAALADRPVALRFAFASCQDWSHGFYSAYRHMAEDDLDLVIHLGDYVYEYGTAGRRRPAKTPVPDVLHDGAAGPRPAGGCSTRSTRATRTCSARTRASRGS